jgi:hypothetical protein
VLTRSEQFYSDSAPHCTWSTVVYNTCPASRGLSSYLVLVGRSTTAQTEGRCRQRRYQLRIASLSSGNGFGLSAAQSTLQPLMQGAIVLEAADETSSGKRSVCRVAEDRRGTQVRARATRDGRRSLGCTRNEWRSRAIEWNERGDLGQSPVAPITVGDCTKINSSAPNTVYSLEVCSGVDVQTTFYPAPYQPPANLAPPCI